MRPALAFGFAYWAAVFGVAFALGMLRNAVIAPRIGATAAVMLELPLVLAASYAVARALLDRQPLPFDQRIAAGGFAFVLLMLAEAGLAATISRLSLADWMASLVRMPGILGLAGQLGFAAIPALAGRDAAT